METKLELPPSVKAHIKKEIRKWAEKIQRNSDIIDVLCRISLCDPNLKNNAGETCFDLAEGKFPYIMFQLEEQVLHLEHVIEQRELEAEDEEYKSEIYVWKTDHTDLMDMEGKAGRAYVNAQLERGMFERERGRSKASSMHTQGGINDYTDERGGNQSRIF